MVLVSVLIAPALMAVATAAERRLGFSAAGWIAALPVSLAVAVLAVAADSGAAHAGAMALSAGAHVFAQVIFGTVFAAAVVRRGMILGGAAGTVAYLVCSLVLAQVPDLLAVSRGHPSADCGSSPHPSRATDRRLHQRWDQHRDQLRSQHGDRRCRRGHGPTGRTSHRRRCHCLPRP